MLLYTALAVVILEYFGSADFYAQHFNHSIGSDINLRSQLWWALSTITVYLIIPALIVIILFRQKLSEFGMTLRIKKKHIVLYIALYLIVLPFILYASTRTDFQNIYPFYRNASLSNIRLFLLWELAYLTQFVALEFFFRGFLAIGLERYVGRLSVWIAVIPYCMIHFHKPVLEATGAIIAGLVLGELARRTRTIFGGVVVHAGVALTMDMLALKR